MAEEKDAWREVTAEWQGGTAFVASNKAGGSAQMGVLDDRPGLSPMEFLLAGLAGCTGADVASILEKMRKPLKNMEVSARGKRAESHPRVYTEIEISFIFWGDGLDPRSVETAIQLSQEKYCAASAMLGAVARIRSTYQILAPGEQAKTNSAVPVSLEENRKP
jgi:putative redox protein